MVKVIDIIRSLDNDLLYTAGDRHTAHSVGIVRQQLNGSGGEGKGNTHRFCNGRLGLQPGVTDRGRSRVFRSRYDHKAGGVLIQDSTQFFIVYPGLNVLVQIDPQYNKTGCQNNCRTQSNELVVTFLFAVALAGDKGFRKGFSWLLMCFLAAGFPHFIAH